MLIRTLLSLTGYLLLYIATCAFIASLFHAAQPDPYMDELFHSPQSQMYCDLEFNKWDPKITTFPGLYLTAVAYVHTLFRVDVSHVLGATIEAVCNLTVLRSLNILYGVACIPLFYLLTRQLHRQWVKDNEWNAILATVQFSLFPLVFFFQFLYYTDLASLFWTLLTYYAYLNQFRFLASSLGFVAVLMRQTNILWIGFMLLTRLGEEWVENSPEVFGEDRRRVKSGVGSSSSSSASSSPSKQDQAAAVGEKEDKISSVREIYHPTSWATFPRTLFFFVVSCLRALPSIIMSHFGELLLCLTFVIFVVLNDFSIVIGDKGNHSLSVHGAQMGYFVAFSIGFTIINVAGDLSRLPVLLGKMLHGWKGIIVLCLMFAAAVHKSTIAHPFLLSDNRHYPFYLWKNVLGRGEIARLAVVPFYAVACWLMQQMWSSASGKHRFFQFSYWLVVIMCLCPTPLLEFRYFIMPFYVWVLHSLPNLCGSKFGTVLSIALYAVINAATIFIFLKKPFNWADGSVARFMW